VKSSSQASGETADQIGLALSRAADCEIRRILLVADEGAVATPWRGKTGIVRWR
jgi:hypothetical protein